MVATTPMIRAAAGLSLNFGPSDSEKAIYFAPPERVVGFWLGAYPCVLAPHVLAFVHFSSPGLGGFVRRRGTDA